MNRRTVFGLILLLLLIIFLAQNTQDATLKFLFIDIENAPQTIVILISTLIGLLFGLFGPKILDFMYESRKERQAKEQMRQEVANVAKTTAEEVLKEAHLKDEQP